MADKQKPIPTALSLTHDDLHLLKRLKTKMQIFQTTALIRWALRRAAKAEGMK